MKRIILEITPFLLFGIVMFLNEIINIDRVVYGFILLVIICSVPIFNAYIKEAKEEKEEKQ